ncbi:hypothetical protein HYW19_00550 [Candidatus Woesearchaeota archaeon]|nr:hypothetical protein [Candidatus Woesearchaeota archaeon]
MANKDLETILMQDLHVVAIHPVEEWNLPSLDEIGYSLWVDIGPRRLALERLYKLLNGPYIEDNLENHELRRRWRTQMEEKYPWFYSYYVDNALRVNTMVQVVQSAMRLLKRGYKGLRREEFEALAQAAHQKTEEAASNYDSKSIYEKINAARQVKYAVYNVIMFLYNQGADAAKETLQCVTTKG